MYVRVIEATEGRTIGQLTAMCSSRAKLWFGEPPEGPREISYLQLN